AAVLRHEAPGRGIYADGLCQLGIGTAFGLPGPLAAALIDRLANLVRHLLDRACNLLDTDRASTAERSGGRFDRGDAVVLGQERGHGVDGFKVVVDGRTVLQYDIDLQGSRLARRERLSQVFEPL